MPSYILQFRRNAETLDWENVGGELDAITAQETREEARRVNRFMGWHKFRVVAVKPTSQEKGTS